MPKTQEPSSGPVAPFPPTEGQVKVEAVPTPTVSPEEARWTPEERGANGIVKGFLKRIDAIGHMLARGTSVSREAKIARNLEPSDWSTYEVNVPIGTTMQPLVGSRPNRRDLMIQNPSAFPINIAPQRLRGEGGLGLVISSSGGSFTIRTQGAVFGCCPTGTPPTSGAQGTPVTVQVTEELY